MRSNSHHAALLRQEGALHVTNVPTEGPGLRDLLVALSFVGVCGTDLQILNGSRPDTAQILGHEGVGVVVQAGPEAVFRVGEQVVFNPAAELSEDRILGHNVPGLFQQYIAVSSREVDRGLVLPAGGSALPITAALTEPLAAVIYAHELIARAVHDLRTAVIFGAGPIGLLTALWLREAGIHAILVHPNQARLDTAIARQLVNADSVVPDGDDLPQRILACNNGIRLDAAVICTTRQGAPQALRHAVDVVKDGACIDLIANYPESAPAPPGMATETLRAVRAANVCGTPADGHYAFAEISGRRVAFTGHRGTSPEHLRQALRTLQSAGSPYAKLITHVLSLAEAAAAITLLSQSHDRVLYGQDCIKAVIHMARA